MKPNDLFTKQPRSFWAQVKLLSMGLGYSRKDVIKVYTITDIVDYLKKLELSTDHLLVNDEITKEGQLLVDYFQYRSDMLRDSVQTNLMDREQAKEQFELVIKDYDYTVKVPFNKQSGDKKHYSYLTGLVNVLTEKTLGSIAFDPDPRQLTVVTKNEKPTRTLARRFDGAYPSIVNPLAIWEIKEYYGTKTFGSRVADGVYETMLDGYELEELRKSEDIDIKHYLIIDDYFTWWSCGKSYLCRIFDMLHEGFLDEVIVGKQVVTRWPEIVKAWNHDATKSTVESRERLLQP